LKLQYDETLSKAGFNFNLRRYAVALAATLVAVPLTFTIVSALTRGQGITLVHISAQCEPFLTQNAPSASPNTL
jgi:hypothetical protein